MHSRPDSLSRDRTPYRGSLPSGRKPLRRRNTGAQFRGKFRDSSRPRPANDFSISHLPDQTTERAYVKQVQTNPSPERLLLAGFEPPPGSTTADASFFRAAGSTLRVVRNASLAFRDGPPPPTRDQPTSAASPPEWTDWPHASPIFLERLQTLRRFGPEQPRSADRPDRRKIIAEFAKPVPEGGIIAF